MVASCAALIELIVSGTSSWLIANPDATSPVLRIGWKCASWLGNCPVGGARTMSESSTLSRSSDKSVCAAAGRGSNTTDAHAVRVTKSFLSVTMPPWGENARKRYGEQEARVRRRYLLNAEKNTSRRSSSVI